MGQGIGPAAVLPREGNNPNLAGDARSRVSDVW